MMARTQSFRRSSFEFESFITSYFAYRDLWTPVVGKILPCEMEKDNVHDAFAVAVQKEGVTIDHMPQEFSNTITYVLSHVGGSVFAEVLGKPVNTRRKGPETLSRFKVRGEQEAVETAKAIIMEYLSRCGK